MMCAMLELMRVRIRPLAIVQYTQTWPNCIELQSIEEWTNSNQQQINAECVDSI